MAVSWRDVLRVGKAESGSLTQNTHNTQKPPDQGNSADIADIADIAYENPKLLEALSTACAELPIKPIEVRDALATEDIDAWNQGEIGIDTLAAFARSLVQRREMERGKVPAHFTERATCKRCGPVWLWFRGEVLGCPWCWNRLKGRPIPRPQPVHCGDCRHFRRTDHPHLGHCAKGEPEAVAGLWDEDQRCCEFHQPG